MHPILLVLALPHTLRFVYDIYKDPYNLKTICVSCSSGYFIYCSVPFFDLVAAYSVLAVSGNVAMHSMTHQLIKLDC